MKNLLHRIRNDNRGSTMIESVTTILIMTIILPILIIMISSALNTREVADTISSGTINAASVQTSLNNDIETASAIKIVGGNVLKLRSQDGLCKSWKIQDNNVVRATSSTAVTDSSDWLTIGEDFAPIADTDVFLKGAAGSVGYNFAIGENGSMGELKGTATQSSASSGSGGCW